LFHYTDAKGYKAISSQQTWLFKASKPPGAHPRGAYFTNLPPGTKNLGKKLFVRGCADKIAFVFCFCGGDDRKPLEGGRGAFIFYSVDDYAVEKERHGPHGSTEEVREELA
jgi:hypothetical protein